MILAHTGLPRAHGPIIFGGGGPGICICLQANRIYLVSLMNNNLDLSNENPIFIVESTNYVLSFIPHIDNNLSAHSYDPN